MLSLRKLLVQFLTIAMIFCKCKTTVNGFGTNLIKVPEDDISQVVCSMAFLRKYYNSGESLSGSVLYMSLTSAVMHTQKRLLEAIHSQSDLPWSVVIRDPKNSKSNKALTTVLNEKPQCYFVVVENLEDEDLEDIFDDWKLTVNWNPLAQFVVFLCSVEETEEEMTELMTEILLSFMNKKIYNVNVFGQNEENGFYYAKSVFPYQPDNNCGNRVITIETLDVCDYHMSENPVKDYDDDEEENTMGESSDGDGAEDNGGDTDEENTDDMEMTNDGDSGHIDDDNNDTVNDSDNADKEDNPSGNSYDDGDMANKDDIADDESVNSKAQKAFIKDDKSDLSTIEELSPKTFKSKASKVMLDSDKAKHTSSIQVKNEPIFFFREVYRALFLDKFPKDLSGCPLAAAYRPWEPYIFSDTMRADQDYTEVNDTTQPPSFPSDNSDEIETKASEDYNSDFKAFSDYGSEVVISNEETGEKMLNGIEYKLLQTIGERLNIKIDLQNENSNLYHLFQQLIDGEIEMVIGGIDEDPSMSQYVSTTVPYHQDDLTWCVAKARRSHSIFNFLASFSLIVWLVSLIYIVIVSMTINWMQRKLKVRSRHLNGFFSVMFHVFGIVFIQSMPLVIVHKPLRIAFFTTFFLAFIFLNAYQSILISTLTTPKSAYQIHRVEEIFQNRMIIKGSVENVRHLNKEGEIFRYIREKFQMCYNIEECLIEAAENERIAVAVSRQHSFYNPRIPRSRLYCFDRNENIYVYLITMLLPKKFHLLHKINPVIQYVIESGHMQKWARDLDMRRHIRENRNHAHEDRFRSLTLGQIFGTFVLTGALLGISLLVFILECCVYWLATKRPRTRLKIVKYLHRMFQRRQSKQY